MKFTIDALNHLLRQNSWAAEKLRAQQGKCIRIALPPFAQTLVIDGGGEFIAALPDATIDAEISLSPGAALRLLLQPQGAPQALLTGEMELASAVGRVLQGLEWDMEEDLSRVVGDIAAHQITQTGGRIRQELGRKLEAGSAMLAEYWLEEQPLIAKARHLEQFSRDVDTLRDDAARLDQRLAALEAKH